MVKDAQQRSQTEHIEEPQPAESSRQSQLKRKLQDKHGDKLKPANEKQAPSGDNVKSGFDRWLPFLVIGGIVIFAVIGWQNLLWSVGWVVVVISGIAAIVLGLIAVLSEKFSNEQVGFGIAAVICAGIAIFAYESVQPTNETQVVDKESSEVSSAAAEATLAYWNAVPRCLDRRGDRIETREEMVAFFRQSAGRIERLPTADVDPLAIEWAFDAAASLRQFADVTETIAVDEQKLAVRSFVQGYNGNLLEGISDISNTVATQDEVLRNATSQLADVWNQRSARVRADLTRKYDVQFAPISWD